MHLVGKLAHPLPRGQGIDSIYKKPDQDPTADINMLPQPRSSEGVLANRAKIISSTPRGTSSASNVSTPRRSLPTAVRAVPSATRAVPESDALLKALYGSRQGLDAYIRVNRRQLRLTDDEIFLLHLRRRRLELERNPTKPPLHTHLDGEGGQPRTPIKVVVLGDAPLLLDGADGSAVLPILALEVLTTVGGGVPRVARARAQVWTFDDESMTKGVRTACFQAAEAFIISFSASAPAAAAAAAISKRLAEVRAWQAVHGVHEDIYSMPIVLTSNGRETYPITTSGHAGAASGGSHIVHRTNGARDATQPPPSDGEPDRDVLPQELSQGLTDDMAHALVQSLGLSSYVPHALIAQPERAAAAGAGAAAGAAAGVTTPGASNGGRPGLTAALDAVASAPQTPTPLTPRSRRAGGVGAALQEAVRLAAERRDQLSDPMRAQRTRDVEMAEATLRPHLTPPAPRARLDLTRGLLVLTPPPPPATRVHYRIVPSAADAADAARAADAPAATPHGEITAAFEPRIEALLPTPTDPYIDTGGALALPEAVDALVGGAILLRAFAPCRYPSRLTCVRLPPRAPPPTGRFDWDHGVMRLACARPAAANTADALLPQPDSRLPPPTAPASSNEAAGAVQLSQIAYSLDPAGTPPNLSDEPLWYDHASGVPLQVGASSLHSRLAASAPPPILTAIAVVPGMWPSEPSRFEPPHQLPPPRGASLDTTTRMLTMPEPPPGVEYRFTLDGAAPSLASPCYAGPIRLPQVSPEAIPAGACLQLRVRAFPAPACPSDELSMRLSLHAPQSRPLGIE